MAKKKSVKKATLRCGDFGGVNAKGNPCGVRVKSGRCKYHTDEYLAMVQEKKKLFLEYMESGTVSLTGACTGVVDGIPGVGVDPATIWRWRQIDAEFNAACEEAVEKSDKIRVKLVEDALFKNAIGGNVVAQQVILYNRAPNRWQDRRNIRHTVEEDSDETLARLLGVNKEDLPE